MNAARFPSIAALLLAAAACGKSEPAAEEKPKEEMAPEPTASASPGLDLGSLGGGDIGRFPKRGNEDVMRLARVRDEQRRGGAVVGAARVENHT